MQAAAAAAERTIAVLSPAFLESGFTAAEWADAFRKDPTGENKTLVPVRVVPTQLDGLLASVVYVDLVGLDENACRERLIAGVRVERAKPRTARLFPGNKAEQPQGAIKVDFPGGLPRIWNIPYPANPYFVGRYELLQNLRKALTQKVSTAIVQPNAVHGLGGVGKTQLAVEYAWQHRTDYDAVLWVSESSPLRLPGSFYVGFTGMGQSCYSQVGQLRRTPGSDVCS